MIQARARPVLRGAAALALVLVGCVAQESVAPQPASSTLRAAASATLPAPSGVVGAPTSSAPPTAAPRGSAPLSAGAVADAGALLVQGADDGIYRYDGVSGTLERAWRGSTFDREVADGVYVVGRHGGVALLRWDGAAEAVPCGSGIAADVAPTGACASSGNDGVAVRWPGEPQARVVLPPDWRGGSPAWSPDGRRLLLVRTIEPRPGPGMDPGLSALWVLEADGRPREVYRPPDRGVLASPRWSPDGTKALVRQIETTSNSFAADGVGITTVLVDLATATGRSLGITRSETWGPGMSLAFVRGGSRLTWSNKELVVLQPNGAETVRAGQDGAHVGLAPAWGPLGRLAWVRGPTAADDYGGAGYIDGVGAGRRVAVVEQAGRQREVACGDGRVVEGVRWSQDAAKVLLLCRKPGRDPFPLELWLYRLADDTSAPLVRGLASDSAAAGFGFYGAQPALTSVAAWSLAVTSPASCVSASAAPAVAPLLPTNAGPVATRLLRDDAWTRPSLVPPAFVQYIAPADAAYAQIVCHPVYVYGYGLSEGSKMILALGPIPTAFRSSRGDPQRPPGLANPTPGLGLQLWLMDVQFSGMTADASGVVTVRIERRPGFEIVLFDLEAVARSPHPSGSLLFRFVDAGGSEAAPPIVRPVRASWEYGR